MCRSNGPIDIEHFRSLLVEHACEHAEEKLLSIWYPPVIALFNKPKSMCSASVRSASLQSSSFYKCVDTLLGNQLRGMLSLTIQHYVELFREEDTTCLPQFKLQLCLEGNCMEFFPSIPELEFALLCLVETVAKSLSNVSTIEVSMYLHIMCIAAYGQSFISPSFCCAGLAVWGQPQPHCGGRSGSSFGNHFHCNS